MQTISDSQELEKEKWEKEEGEEEEHRAPSSKAGQRDGASSAAVGVPLPQVKVQISYMEIYQDTGYDLLNPGARPGSLMLTLPKVFDHPPSLSSSSSIFTTITGTGERNSRRESRRTRPLSPRRTQRTRSPPTPPPGVGLSEGGRDNHEPTLFPLACHLHRHHDDQTTGLRGHHKVRTSYTRYNTISGPD